MDTNDKAGHGDAPAAGEPVQEAIARAIHAAQAGDVVLLAGKGHETYQVRGTVKYPFDEREIVREIISEGVT